MNTLSTHIGFIFEKLNSTKSITVYYKLFDGSSFISIGQMIGSTISLNDREFCLCVSTNVIGSENYCIVDYKSGQWITNVYDYSKNTKIDKLIESELLPLYPIFGGVKKFNSMFGSKIINN